MDSVRFGTLYQFATETTLKLGGHGSDFSPSYCNCVGWREKVWRRTNNKRRVKEESKPKLDRKITQRARWAGGSVVHVGAASSMLKRGRNEGRNRVTRAKQTRIKLRVRCPLNMQEGCFEHTGKLENSLNCAQYVPVGPAWVF